MNKGLFITFEGIDGSGKSTQARKLAAYLKDAGHEVVNIADIGGAGVDDVLC